MIYPCGIHGCRHGQSTCPYCNNLQNSNQYTGPVTYGKGIDIETRLNDLEKLLKQILEKLNESN